MSRAGPRTPSTNDESKSAAKEGVSRNEPLDDAGDLLSVLLAHAPAAVAIVDRELRYRCASERWLSAFGLSDRNIIGENYAELLPAVPARWKEACERALAGEAATCHEDTLLRADGAVDWVRWGIHPWREATGQIGGLVLSVEFIGERKEGERALLASHEQTKAARAELEAARREAVVAQRMKNEFLALLGHELRNPLAPILTALDLMKIRDHSGATRERGVIERQVQHLVCLVDDLLDVSRITRGQIELKKSTIEIAQLIGQAVDMASPLFERRAHELRVAVPSRGLLVSADEGRMLQIFTNLLTNAAKYTEPGGSISMTAARDNGHVVIRVRDNGCGIRPEMLPHIFEMFVQGERTLDRSRGGLGLGLTIVRSLVELHGGTVTAHSEGAGKGTEFVVTFPAVSQQVLDLPPDEPAATPLPATPCGRRVLVVDDNTDAAETLADILREHGHETSIAHDGPSALTQALLFHPDVALLDIGLPVMDGYELARRFREQPELKRVQLLAVTGYGQQEDKERSRAAGFYEHLVKPIDFSRLRALIDRSPTAPAERANGSG